MTTFERAAHELRSLDVAAWPAYKLLALGAGAVVFIVTLC
ncbi:Hypothetical protein ERS075652_01960 [Mycobacteroides abscessus]|nr:Hypothetical protein ERS075652_01960 [Mycobacteroides abscessus]